MDMAPPLARLLALAVREQASDLHLSAGAPPLARVHGQLRPLASEPLDDATVQAWVASAMDAAQRQHHADGADVDFAIDLSGVGRFRAHAYRQARGAGAAFRAIAARVPTLAEIGAPPLLGELALRPRGLLLVTGPAGSGKSTTLAALVGHRAAHRPGHTVTVEDPIEFVHGNGLGLVSQREVGRHAPGFSAALRSALREDPDAILLGEIRDLDTMRLALTAAETGHLVLATLHTAGAAKAVDRVIDVFAAAEQPSVRALLSESLVAVVAQTLLPTCDGNARAAAFEVLMGTPAVRNLVREGKVAQLYSVMQTGQAQGMQTLDQSLQALVRRGIVSAEQARALARAPDGIAG